MLTMEQRFAVEDIAKQAVALHEATFHAPPAPARELTPDELRQVEAARSVGLYPLDGEPVSRPS